MTTVQVKFVDAEYLYVSWRWEHAPGEPRVAALDPAGLPLDELAAALPTPLPGETVPQALRRALSGALTDLSRERVLAEKLARGLFPPLLASELNEYLARGDRVHLRIQPAPAIAQVPWEALRLSEGERLAHIAEVSLLAPATVRNAPARVVSAWDPSGPVVGVLDPRVPGFADDSELGSVLGEVSPSLVAMASGMVPGGFRRDDVTRVMLESLLASAGRFLYVGHVTTAGHGLDARLHLSCGAETSGRAELRGAHRPLTAADIALGPWRVPNRVALIACKSGGDARFVEPSGLVAAMVHCGAEYVTGTRWSLPTGEAFAAAVVAVDGAHRGADPVAGVGAWQREQADLWESTGDLAASPLLWGAFSTCYAPGVA